MAAALASGLPLRSKLLYASSSLGSEALGQARNLWLLYYYAPPADADNPQLLPVAVAGAILFAARLVESFDDALVGFWSDRTRSRLGRRIPFVLGAAPLWALFAFLLFTPPADAGNAVTALYLFVMLEAFFLFGTLAGGPYEALLPELARTSRDRVTIVGMRVYFGAAGAGAGLVASGLLIDAAGFRAMALVMAALALIFRYAGLFGVWERARASREVTEIRFGDAMRTTFANRAFLSFLPTYVLFQTGFLMLVGVLPYWVKAVLAVEDEGTWVAALTAIAIASMVAAVPAFALLARRSSKRQAYRTAMVGCAVTFPLLFVAGFVPGVPDEAEIVALMVVAAVPLAGNFLFPAALTADIVDDETARTGLRREATYYGAQNFVEKTATSASPLVLALLLLLGSSAEDPLGIRLVGPVAALFVLAAYLIFRRYELPDEVSGAVADSRSSA